MEKKKIDRIIEAFRNYKNLKEEMMTANPPGKGGGVGGQVDPTGKDGPPGLDPLLCKKGNTVDFRRIKPNYRRWIKDK